MAEFRLQLGIVIFAIILSSLAGVLGNYFYKPIINDFIVPLIGQKSPDLTAFLKMLGCIKVDRYSHDVSFINKCTNLLQKGKVIEIYPESRLADEGEETPLPFTTSTVYLALETDTRIIPVYTEGSYFCKTRNHVIVGKPFDAREYYDNNLSHSENVEQITLCLRNRILELKEELERRKAKTKKA
jgi:1-acyl-sn-glycerol-3-phosphate acyltransferase